MNAVGAARDARLPGRGPRSQKGGSETLSYFQFRKIASLVWKRAWASLVQASTGARDAFIAVPPGGRLSVPPFLLAAMAAT